MPDRERRDPSLEIALDRYWNMVLAGSADPPGEAIDPDLVATVQRVHALDVTPPLSPTFASTLWEDLMHVNAPSAAAISGPPFTVVAPPRRGVLPGRWTGDRPRLSFSRIAAAILLLALLAGSAFAALYPLQHWGGSRLPLFAGSGTPPAEAIMAREEPIVDLTLTDIAPLSAEGGIAITNYPPGGSSQERAATSLEVLYIAAGPMTASVIEAPQPMRVIPPREATTDQPESALSAGQESVLVTGTTLVAPPGTVVELRNDGSVPTSMLDLLWVTASTSSESGGAMWARATPIHRQDLTPPVSIVLWRLTLDAGATVPPPASSAIAQSVGPVDQTRMYELHRESEGSYRNPGDEPLEVYILNVSGASGTPVAAT
jgi:hypothetical protein